MPAKTTIGLAYTPGLEAPVIVASGKNAIADRMLEIARDCGIRIVEDPLLADALSAVEIGSCIPSGTWQAVAAIFAFLDRGIDEGRF